MLKKLLVIITCILCLTQCSSAQEKDRAKGIESIFTKMEQQGIDTKQPMLYGYFFYDKDKSKLQKLETEMLKENYRLVRLEKADGAQYILHVEKIETHTKESLLERENQLEKMAARFNVETYDGWDVGNADPSKPLVSNDSFEKSLTGKTVKELYALGNQLYEQEANEKVINVFEKCLKENYMPDTCHYKLGIAYEGIGNVALGLKHLEEALKINPKYYKACFNIGVFCYDNGQYEKSIEFYEKAAILNPKDDRVFYGIAAAQYVLGRLKEAKNNCEKTLELNRNHTDAKNLLESIKPKLG